MSNNDSSSSDEFYSSDEEYCGNNGNLFNNELLNRKYLLIKKIGYGAFSSVWLSFNFTNNQYNAIKIQNHDDYEEGAIEVKILTKLKKNNCEYLSNIVDNFIEIKDDNKYVCMVFELCACNIYQIIRHNRNKLSEDIVKKIIKQTLIATNELHKLKYYHTDIKPENILLVGKNSVIQDIIKDYDKNNFMDIYNGLKKNFFDKKNLDLKNNNHKKKFNKKYKDSLLKKTNVIILKKLDLFIEDNETEDNETENSDSENDEDFKIDMKLLEDIKIKLTDFGTIFQIKEKEDEEIQTRYYRSPEVLLGLIHNEKVDIWSIGCMILELLFNKTYFDPTKDEEFDRDFHHLHDIQKLCGYIPEYMMNKCPDKSYYFKKNRFKRKIEFKLLDAMLKEKEIYSDELLEFLQKTLNIDYKTRLSTEECLKLSWLNI